MASTLTFLNKKLTKREEYEEDSVFYLSHRGVAYAI
jgi:hypothetical protein